MSPAQPVCAFCGQPVRIADVSTWRRVTGWEQPRTGGGTHALSLREVVGEFAHDHCMNDRRRGVLPGQGVLL